MELFAHTYHLAAGSIFGLLYTVLLCDWRFSRRRVWLLTAGLSLLLAAAASLTALLVPADGPGEFWYRLYDIAQGIGAAYFISRRRGAQPLFASLSAGVFTSVCGSLAGSLLLFVPGLLGELLFLLPFAAALLCLCFFRRYFLEMQRGMAGGWVWMCLIPASFSALLMGLTYIPTPLTQRPENIPSLVVVAVIVLLIYCSLYAIYRYTRRQKDLERENEVMGLQVDNLTARLETTRAAEERAAALRHDLRHYVALINSCLDSGDYAQVRAATENLSEHCGGFSLFPRTACSNDPAVNAVLGYYAAQADAQSIAFSARLDLPEGFQPNRTELSVVLSNALENALHACEQQPPHSKREITLSSGPAGSQLLIRITNTLPGPVRFDSKTGLPCGAPSPAPSTAGGPPVHGIGVKSIAAFARKYGGLLDYQEEDGRLTLRLLL